VNDSNKEQAGEVTQEQKRNYFRIEDVLRLVATPISADDHHEPSRILSSTEVLNKPILAQAANIPDNYGNKWLTDAVIEINDKLDFMINYFMLQEEGLLTAEKKKVNISASGIQFTVNYSVKVKDTLEIKLLLPSYPPVAVLLYGEITRVSPSGDGANAIALKYVDMAEVVRERIIQYALDHQRGQTKRLKDLD
jgi:hypothetical protein